MSEPSLPYESRTDPSLSPLISIITSTYQAATHLPWAAASIRVQDFDDFEWIVIDGGSSDGTVEILRENSDLIDYWLSEPDTGIYDAWNKGIRQARGRWIMFLGADDELAPAALSTLSATIKECGDGHPIDFIAGRVTWFRGDTPLRTIGRPWSWHTFRHYMSIAHTGGVHSAEYFKRYGLFDDSYSIAGDYEMLLRAGPNLSVVYVPSVLAYMQVGGISSRNPKVFKEWRRAKERYSVLPVWRNAWDEAWAKIKWNVRRLVLDREGISLCRKTKSNVYLSD